MAENNIEKESSIIKKKFRTRDELSQKEVGEILEKYEGGVSQRQLAKDYGMSQGSVFKLLKEHNANRKDIVLEDRTVYDPGAGHREGRLDKPVSTPFGDLT